MTPGTYIRKCRERAGLSLEDLALRLATVPKLSCRSRIDWLGAIEADAPTLSPSAAVALHGVLGFDLDVLAQLLVIHKAPRSDVAPPRLCQVCACSENDPCFDGHGAPCAWSGLPGVDLCTAHPVRMLGIDLAADAA